MSVRGLQCREGSVLCPCFDSALHSAFPGRNNPSVHRIRRELETLRFMNEDTVNQTALFQEQQAELLPGCGLRSHLAGPSCVSGSVGSTPSPGRREGPGLGA